MGKAVYFYEAQGKFKINWQKSKKQRGSAQSKGVCTKDGVEACKSVHKDLHEKAAEIKR